jgi:hypothetical protein
MKPWAERPTELGYLFNPGYCGWLLREAVEGYASEAPGGMPLPLAFLALPVVLHKPTRDLLPRSVASTLLVWLQESPEVRVGVAERTRELAPFAREALLFLGSRGHLAVTDDGRLTVGGKLGKGKAALLARSGDLKDALQKARFVGRWFAAAGTPAAVFQAWGVCP